MHNAEFPQTASRGITFANVWLRMLMLAAGLASVAMILRFRSAFMNQTAAEIAKNGLPIAVFVFLVIAERLKPAWRMNLALLSFTMIVGACLVEFFVGTADRIVTDRRLAERGYDRRSRLEVVDALNAKGARAVPVFQIGYSRGVRNPFTTPGGEPILPLAGISNRVTVTCNENNDYLVYESDERGFHNPKGLWDAVPLQVAAVGDSFTHGSCVKSEENVVARIRERFPRTLNLGKSGNGPLIELATIREYLPQRRPEVVLWFYCEQNDLKDMAREDESAVLMRYFNDETFQQGLDRKQSDVDQVIEKFLSEARSAADDEAEAGTSALSRFVRMTQTRSFLESRYRSLVFKPEIESAGGPRQQAQLGEILRRANKHVASWGGKLFFIYLPTLPHLSKGAWITDVAQWDEIHDRVLKTVQDAGVPSLDLTPVFVRQPNLRTLFGYRSTTGGVHYNADGYALVARETLAFLEAQRATPRPLQ